MGRRASSWWCKRTQGYLARLGEVSPKTQKRKSVVLRDEHGEKVRRGDEPARAEALARLLRSIEATARRYEGATVLDVCDAYIEWQVAERASPRTVADHRRQLQRFMEFAHRGMTMAERPAASLTVEDLWALEDAGLDDLRHLYMSVLACLRWAAKPVRGRDPVRLIPSYPFEGVDRPRPAPPSEKLVPWAAARALLRFARGRAKTRPLRWRVVNTRRSERLRVLCLHLIAATGARPFEAVALEWSEVDWEKGILKVRADRDKSRRKKEAPRKPRRVAVPRRLLQALRVVEGWPDRHPTYVFATIKSRLEGPPRAKTWQDWLRAELKPAAVAAGVPIPEKMTMYWLRHEWQTTGLEVESAEGVAAAAGNSPQVLLATYEHTRVRRIVEVSEKVHKARRKREA